MADDALYDAYLEACLAGEAEEPAVFLARHPDVDEETRAGIEAIYRGLREREAAADELPFERVGEFKLLERLDAGGMGSVFLAEQESLGRVVALKLIRPELQRSREAQARFDRESHAVAQLRHPNIVTVFAAGEAQGVRYLAMEMVPGRQLDDVLAAAAAGRENVPAERIVRWIAALARALDYAHERGIVHRDVKPANIRITTDDRPLLLDFGIAYDMGADLTTLTRAFAGSPTYAAPEQIVPARGATDGRTDVYALGVTLYQCLTGVVPFSANTVEGVFHRTLHEDPTPPRRLRQTVGKELEIVTLKAMEKAPTARYQTAGAFADDLDAILAFRPIRARAPGAFTRAYKWVRRRPAAAVGIAAVVVLLLVLAGLRIARARGERGEARRLVGEAERTIDEYRTKRDRSVAFDRDFRQLEREVHRRYFTPEEDRQFAEHAREVRGVRRDGEAVFYRVLELLRRAEQLDPDVAGADNVRAALYFAKWQEADDRDTKSVYKKLVDEHDHAGHYTDRFTRRGRLRVTVEPADAEIYLFRYRELDEPRMVPVPVGGGAPPVPYGTLVERVVRGTGVEAEDLVIDGVVWHVGRKRDGPLPDDLVTRRTAAPLFPRAACRIEGEVEIEIDEYLLWARRPGFESQRHQLRVGRDTRVQLRLLPTGSTPPGFVHVNEFWIMEREVTAAEYLVFLNASRARIAEAKDRILVPRGPDQNFWEPGPDGAYVLPDEIAPESPVLGVSFHDAVAYTAWASVRDGRTYALPSLGEWERAGGRHDSPRIYPWGYSFRPKFACSNWSRPVARVEPVLSYPIDESPQGAFDMAGSAMEWLDAPYFTRPADRWLAGGSWGMSDPKLFKVPGGWGAQPHAVSGNYGFRLVWRGK